MDRYCPECNSNMTPSLVGYLCVNCGHVQRFYSAQESALVSPVIHQQLSPNTSNTSSHPKLHKKASTKPQNSVKQTIKRLMVPELSPPHSHLIGDGDSNIQPVLADRIVDEQQMPALKSADQDTQVSYDEQPSTRSDQAHNDDISQSGDVPNQSSNLSELQSALHPQRNTSIWIMLGLAILMLLVAAAVLFLIILS